MLAGLSLRGWSLAVGSWQIGFWQARKSELCTRKGESGLCQAKGVRRAIKEREWEA